jgi:hypothetical protein
MTSKPARYRLLRILLPLALFILGCPPPGSGRDAAPDLVLTVVGQPFYLAPTSEGSLLVQVWDNTRRQAAVNAQVEVMLDSPSGDSQQLYTGTTDTSGLLMARFDVPETVDTAEQILRVSAQRGRLRALYIDEVYVGRVYNVLVSTDKPIYQPGQVIHMRGLALDTLALSSAQDQPLTFTVDDPQGNRLMRQELNTSQWGIAAADFVLDSQAPSGDYTVTARMGPVTSSRTVEVEPYKLPRFKIDFSSDRTFYLPGEVAEGAVKAHYFFGKPVAGGAVRIEGFVTDVVRQPIFELNGETDENGLYSYEFQIPDYFVGQLMNNAAQIDLEITVTDTANHAESVTKKVTVAEQPLLVEAVPESGFLRPGIENIVYLQVTYPDDRPVQAELTLTYGDQTQTVQTDEYGLATIRLNPADPRVLRLNVLASVLTEGDEVGPSVQTNVTLGAARGDNAVLLRPERAEYRIGETLNLDIYVAGTAQTVYLDVVKGQQTFGLTALPVSQGVAQAALDLDGSLLGTLELHAYVITNEGEIVRDRRLVLVNPAPAQVEVSLDQEVYRPGDTAILAVEVSRDGAPMAGVLGIAIVDESVFSAGAQDPGFARTYFLLERELAEPRYEIHDFVPFEDDDPSPYDARRDPVRSNWMDRQAMRGGGEDTRIEARQVALFGFFGGELALREAQVRESVAVDSAAEDLSAIAWGWAARLALALPLIGFAFYDGSRRRRKLAFTLLLLSLATFGWGACGSSAEPARSPEMAAAPASADETTATRGETTETRLRQFFPETLYWMPEVETDAEGRARIEVPIADSITTWRVSILASDMDGNLGSAESSVRVFQDFFVEPDLPRFLTDGDEIAVPVSLFNYLDERQTIQLDVEAGDWFEFLEESQVSVEMAANEVSVAYIPIRVTRFGQHGFKVTANGSAMSDAVLREVEVLPDGSPEQAIANGQLEAEVRAVAVVPEEVVPGTARVAVKIYPGVVSQVIDGLEGMLRRPYGCFEQTSSITYPNVMVLDYLKSTGQINPRVQLRAESLINQGYQRLLTFETSVPGGFSLFGDPPPQRMVTAYGLMQFTAMSRVSYVDPALLDRTAAFLMYEQMADGSWHSGRDWEPEYLGTTAYITWALADAGFAETLPVERAVEYLKEQLHLQESSLEEAEVDSPLATPESQDQAQSSEEEDTPEVQPPMAPYLMGMIANALLAVDPADAEGLALLDQLAEMAEQDEEGVLWRAGSASYLGGYGIAADLETTAMITIALLRSGAHPELAAQAINWLIQQRDGFGSFYTTQATVLTLKALILAAQQVEEEGPATVTITFNGGRTQTLTIDASNDDVVQQIVFDDIAPGEQVVDLSMEGERNLQYQVLTSFYRPWAVVPEDAPERLQSMRVDLAYDRTEMVVNDVVKVTALVEMLAPGTAGTVLVDLGLPPGFTPIMEDLHALRVRGVISRYELTGRQIIFYLADVTSGEVYQLEYRLRARYPIRAQAPASQTYDYYTPERQDVSPPQRIIVTLGTPER